MKRQLVKNAFVLAGAALIVVAVALVMLAWIKGGVQPAQTVEIPVASGSGEAAGA